ncbi:MAG: hypothetical protein C3F11_10445 [Methylocystaceae bacterium]|nr:MAG: hypothetical protein C3F11_10445 [Methylocystaceae bacterium]
MIASTLICCIRERRVLVIKRCREPFAGFWVPPGGKIEPDESPLECAKRELSEETGLIAEALELRGIVHEVATIPDWEWLIYVYVTCEAKGDVKLEASLRETTWLPIETISEQRIPPSDKIFLPRVLGDHRSDPFKVKFRYDHSFHLLDHAWGEGG